MSVLSTVIGIIVGGLVVASVGKIYLSIYKTIKQQNFEANKYKVSFKKHFKKVKVPLIKMKIAGELRYFLVDSGATNNVIEKNFYNSVDPKYFNDLKFSDQIISTNGVTEKRPIVGANLSFKKDVFEDVTFIVADIAPAVEFIKNASNIVIAGILGSTFFEKYRWAVDFDERCIWINSLEATQKDE